MKPTDEELLENFRLDCMDVEYEMENHLGRAMTERESNNLFLNFLRRKMGMSFAFSNESGYKPVFTKSVITEVKRVKQLNKFKGKKKKRK